jgi:hypothetical protein
MSNPADSEFQTSLPGLENQNRPETKRLRAVTKK